MYRFVKELSSRIRVAIYSVAEDGQVKRLREGHSSVMLLDRMQQRAIDCVSTYHLDRMLANRAGLL